jgi:hypothetical protein
MSIASAVILVGSDFPSDALFAHGGPTVWSQSGTILWVKRSEDATAQQALDQADVGSLAGVPGASIFVLDKIGTVKETI